MTRDCRVFALPYLRRYWSPLTWLLVTNVLGYSCYKNLFFKVYSERHAFFSIIPIEAIHSALGPSNAILAIQPITTLNRL